MPWIDITGLTKVFGDEPAVHDVNLYVAEGELVCLLGPSGCGKTTTLRCIAGLEDPTRGKISIGRRTVCDADRRLAIPPARRNIGMVFQSYAIWPHLSVAENIAYPLRRRKVQRSERNSRIDKALAAVGLAGFQRRRATELSGGQQQRVALARAIVFDPDVLLFDEPLSNLDARLRQSVREEIKHTHETLGTASIYVTHDQVEAIALADTVVVMQSGQIVQHQKPETVFTHPVNRFVADFVGVENIFSGRCTEAFAETVAVDVPGLGVLRSMHTAAQVQDGERVDVAVRALDLRVSKDEGLPGTNQMTGTVEKVTFLGEFIEVALDVNGVGVRARGRPNELPGSDLSEGAIVALGAAPEHIHVMPTVATEGDDENHVQTQAHPTLLNG